MIKPMRLVSMSMLSIVLISSLPGCNGDMGSNQLGGTVVGAGMGGIIGAGLGRGSLATTMIGAAIGGLIGSSIGSRLDEADRRAAYYAQMQAFNYNQPGRVPWRGPNAYGYYEAGPNVPSPYGYGEYCREYSETIYIDGRPHRGHGTACREPDGSWRIVNSEARGGGGGRW